MAISSEVSKKSLHELGSFLIFAIDKVNNISKIG